MNVFAEVVDVRFCPMFMHSPMPTATETGHTKRVMRKPPTARTYVGLYDDQYGGMTMLGGLVKDAWVFGLLPETQTCQGWTHGAMEALGVKVQAEWDKYGFRVNGLPAEIRQSHERIHAAAILRARALGWDPGSEEEDE